MSIKRYYQQENKILVILQIPLSLCSPSYYDRYLVRKLDILI